MAIAIATAAKRENSMLVVILNAPEVVEAEGADEPEAALPRSGTGGPVAVACTPATTGPLSGVYGTKFN